MTSPHDVYLEACRRGLRLEPAGDRLAVMPKGKCPPDFADVLREHKAELLSWLSRAPCPGWGAIPSAALPLNLAMPRPAPESRERVIAYLLRQTGDRPGPLSAWLVQRENAYFEGPGRTWDCGLICYAAGLDAVTWQLNRSECEVLELLSGLNESSRSALRP
jgi:hypothetical protein